MEKKFVAQQKELIAALSAMQPICSKRTTLDTTTNILFSVGHKELILKSTDLEISLQMSCLLDESTITDPQTFLVSGKRIFEVVKELEGAIECVITSSQITLATDAVKLALHIKNSEEFPPFPERIENLMQLDGTFLQETLDKVAFLVPQNNANPALNGLYIEVGQNGIKMTATDGHRLAQVSSPTYQLDQAQSWLLPKRAILELKKLVEATQGPIFLGMCGNQVVFSNETFNFFCTILADPFPEYAHILDKTSFIPATVDRSSFIKTLRRSSCLLTGQFIATQFAFSPTKLLVSMHNKEVGHLEEELPVSNFQGTMDVRFYAPYLLSGLQALDDESVQFFLKESTKPIIFQSSAEQYCVTYLVMPVSPTAQQ